MRPSLMILVSFSLILAGSCSETPTGTGTPQPLADSRMAVLDGDNPVVQSIRGSGHFLGEPRDRTTTFTVRKYADGTVTGWYKVVGRGGGGHVFVAFDCLHVDGNQAWASGTWVRSSNPDNVGRGYTLRVVDNGEGSGAPPDLIGGNRVEAFDCATEPDINLRPVVLGNVQVTG